MANPRASLEEKLKSLYIYEKVSYPALNEYRDLAVQYGRKGEIDSVNAMLISVADVPYNMHIDGVPDNRNKQELSFEFNVAMYVGSLFGQSQGGKLESRDMLERAMATVPEEYRRSVANSIISESKFNTVWPGRIPAAFHFERDVLELLKTYLQPQGALAAAGFFSAKSDADVSSDWIAATRCSYGN